MGILKEAFDRHRNRDTMRVDAAELIDVHASFSKTFQFRVPIHPRNLSQLIHPHQGYMASMPNRGYSWDEMLAMYELQMISSYEKAKGRTLHGEELSALSFWLLQDTEKKGNIGLEGMNTLMQGLRFTNLKTWSSFMKEFKYTIPLNEFRAEGEEVFRFDLMRQIFLERGL